MTLLEERGPCWPKYTFEIPWHKHQLPPFSIKWYCKRLVVSLLHLSPTKPVLKWDTHCESQFLSALSYGFLISFVLFVWTMGKTCLAVSVLVRVRFFCLACNSPLTDSQAVASWKFVAKVSVLLWLVTINQIDLKVLVQHLIQREKAPLQSDDHVSRQSVC